MRPTWYSACLVGMVVGFVMGVTPVFAFMGSFISAPQGDRAVIVNLKSSDIGYDSDDVNAGDIDRELLLVGLSKFVTPSANVFGSLNYAFGGEMGGDGNELESGYSFSAGGSYNFLERETYSFQAYGQFNYIFEETFKYSGSDTGNRECKLDGYEFLFGLGGTLKFSPRFHLFGAFELAPLSAFTMDVENTARRYSIDIEREVIFGLNFGMLYDFFRWFVKAEAAIGSEMALSLGAGMKF